MADTTPPSPEGLQLRGAPSSGARLSKKAAFIAIAVLTVIVGVIVTNVTKSPPKQNADAGPAKTDLQPALNAANTLTKDVPDVIAAPAGPPPPLRSAPGDLPAPIAAPVKDPEADARLADTAVPGFASAQSASITPAVAGYSASADPQDDAGGTATNGAPARGSNPTQGASREAADTDPNHQAAKTAFLNTPESRTYLNGKLTAPRSPFELKTGTVIPGVLISEANSDLPGEIIAQVSQNVYDSATGNNLLIPQGTRLYGRYDSGITFGQGRLLIRWQRLIFPNAYTLELQGMEGHDQGGGAGFEDQVNNHYARIFGWGLATSVLSAGFQLSQPQQTSTLAVPSNTQVAAAAVGQQMAQLGAQLAARNMAVQPTIVIRKGYRMLVMINKDVVFASAYTP